MVKTRRFSIRSRVTAPAKAVFTWHGRPGALERLTPPWEKVEVVERPDGIRKGSRTILRIRVGPFRRRWVGVFHDVEPGRRFRDEQVKGPFSRWLHTHSFEPEGESACCLEDRIEYVLPLGPVGNLLGNGYTQRKLRRLFAYRHAVTAADLERHLRISVPHPLRIAVSGSTGLVGTSVANFMIAGGHKVSRLVRKEPRPGQDEVFWDPSGGTIDRAGLEGLDAVVHLAGENIASGRWSESRKSKIRDSRVEGTRLLCEALSSLNSPPRVLVSASAIGYYGNRDNEVLDETSPPGSGFLAEVSKRWEEATAPASQAGIRVVNLRVGVVLSARGGALPRMLPPFRIGLGGRLGTGRQVMSWIGLDDLVGIIHFALVTATLSGPVNATAPSSITNAEFTRTLGRILRRATPFPVPAPILRALLGEMGEELLLSGARVRPLRLEEAGFRFYHPELEGALRFELGRLEGGQAHGT